MRLLFLLPPQSPQRFKISLLSQTLSWTWPQVRPLLQQRKLKQKLLVREELGEKERGKIRPAREKMPEGVKQTGSGTTKGSDSTRSRRTIKSRCSATSSNRRRTIEVRRQEREQENIHTCRRSFQHLLYQTPSSRPRIPSPECARRRESCTASIRRRSNRSRARSTS